MQGVIKVGRGKGRLLVQTPRNRRRRRKPFFFSNEDRRDPDFLYSPFSDLGKSRLLFQTRFFNYFRRRPIPFSRLLYLLFCLHFRSFEPFQFNLEEKGENEIFFFQAEHHVFVCFSPFSLENELSTSTFWQTEDSGKNTRPVYCRFLSVSHSKDQFLWEKAPGAIIRTRTPISRIWLLSPDIFRNPKSKVCQIKVRAVRAWLALNFHENTGGNP